VGLSVTGNFVTAQ